MKEGDKWQVKGPPAALLGVWSWSACVPDVPARVRARVFVVLRCGCAALCAQRVGLRPEPTRPAHHAR
jgi:hypothetical protein